MDKHTYEKYKRQVENDLRNYPYWLIAMETPNLGYPTRWGEIGQGGYNGTSTVETDMLKDMERKWKVEVISRVLNCLDSKSKTIIEEWYFRDTMTREQIQEEIGLDKNRFYHLRNRTLKKFMIAIGYI
ncbi:ArpU family transcriptional regulator (endogenous virus) [Clostridium phage phiCT453A]|uniref:nitroreductase n=1 Tax=Clostridium phage phiCT453A TaxID=1567012 RepID=UPI00051395BF|nr:ArpU family phage packaging/lysis transcriptional regulator [Clostridium tetani]YP_009216667.1 nitroreductase [Clostridium phage phiCT453A]AJA42513.1 ArpU family transcriptional regulator [Clostridium phage phiCT453A]KGI42495.1 nitroreductase [Clostridium tetani]RXM58092.1 nitroreductase [Clostridium tetani]